jgi:hypothetical protein
VRANASLKEIFLDYGDEWEAAWQEHAAKFQGGDPNYVSARDWVLGHPRSILRTALEQTAVPYADNMEMRCLNEIADQSLTSEQAEKLWTIDQSGVACDVVDRTVDEDGQVFYQVEFAFTVMDEVTEIEHMLEWRLSGWIVREAISFWDKPYSSDLFLEGVFRHPIGIPDEIFPDAWRDYNYYEAFSTTDSI